MVSLSNTKSQVIKKRRGKNPLWMQNTVRFLEKKMISSQLFVIVGEFGDFKIISRISKHTLPKTNLDPKNDGFLVSMLVLRGVYCKLDCLETNTSQAGERTVLTQ